MKKSLFIIDGYNVIRNHPRYRELSLRDLEMARARLTEDLVGFAALKGVRVILVFDGSKGEAKVSQRKEFLGVEVWFSARGETADQVIERLTFQFRKQAEEEGQINVVTSDYDLQKTVFQKGVLRWSPQELVTEILDSKEEALPAGQKKKEDFLENRLQERIKKALKEFFPPES